MTEVALNEAVQVSTQNKVAFFDDEPLPQFFVLICALETRFFSYLQVIAVIERLDDDIVVHGHLLNEPVSLCGLVLWNLCEFHLTASVHQVAIASIALLIRMPDSHWLVQGQGERLRRLDLELLVPQTVAIFGCAPAMFVIIMRLERT